MHNKANMLEKKDTSHPLVWLLCKNSENNKCWQRHESLHTLCTVSGNVKWCVLNCTLRNGYDGKFCLFYHIFLKRKIFFNSHLLGMTPIIFGHICFPDTFSTMALTFVGGAAAILPLSIGNWQSQEKCQVGLVRFRWHPHWEQKSRQNSPLSATDSGFLVFILRGSEGTTVFFYVDVCTGMAS